MYKTLAGMTGTAKTEEDEFNKIYKLDVYVIPTNKPMIRKDLPDVIYKTKNAKYRAVIREVKKRHQSGQPILVGTTSISQSEILSQLLDKENIVHNVLNAKFHEKEAEIIKDAGQMNQVTIATNMAGRGTDIKLGKGVAELGGLMIIGTERHESRRIDNQLRGRSGRQGDPGTTQFFLSLEDDLMRIFGAENISKFMDKLGMEEDEPITHKMITRSIEKAQKKVEGHNFEIRKYVLEYDDVMNQQREVLYSQRRQVLTAESLRETILGMVDDIIQSGLDKYADEKLYPEEWDFAGLLQQMEQYFVPKGATTVAELENLSRLEVQDKLKKIATDLYNEREAEIGEDTMHQLEKAVMLRVVDSKWMDHLDAMDALKEGINLRAYGQKNPLVEYKFEAYEMFEEMVDSIKHTVVTFLYHIQITYSKPVPQAEDHLKSATEVHQEAQPVSREDIERDERKHD
jgi:preprotein translocase subunit SecA